VAGTTFVYASDRDNHALRKIIFAGGATSLVAGTPTVAGFIDGPAFSARFAHLSSLAMDSTGILYIGENDHSGLGNTAIRKLGLDSYVSTVAGTGAVGATNSVYGVQASFDGVTALALAGDGFLLAADYGNHKIRLVDTMTGAVCDFITGNGITSPSGIATNAAGTMVHIVSGGTHQVMAFGMPAGPTPSPTAPTLPTAEFVVGQSGVLGLVDGTRAEAVMGVSICMSLDDTSSDVVIADSSNKVIRRVTLYGRANLFAGSTAALVTDGIGAAAAMGGPRGIHCDAAGVTWFTEFSDAVIRRISTGGTVATVAGTLSAPGSADANGLSASFNSPAALTRVGAVLYITDHSNQAVRTMTMSGPYTVTTVAGKVAVTGFIDGCGSCARFNAPLGIAANSAGAVYVTERGNHAIRKVAPDNTVTTVVGTGAAGSFNSAIGVQARLNDPYALAFDANDYLFCTDRLNNKVRMVSPAGVVSTLLSTGLNQPCAVAVNAALGTVYVSDFNYVIQTFGPPPAVTASPTAPALGTASMTYGATPGFMDGTGVHAKFVAYGALFAVDTTVADGRIVVSDHGNNRLRRLYASGRVNTFAGSLVSGVSTGYVNGPGLLAQLHGPLGVSVDGSGNTVTAEYYNHVVRKVSSAGVVSTLAGDGTQTAGHADGAGAAALFNFPRDVCATGTEVYVADGANKVVRKIIADGTTSTFAGTVGVHGARDGHQPLFATTYAIAIDGSGTFYVASGTRIVKLTSGGVASTFVGDGSASGTADADVGITAQIEPPYQLFVDANDYIFAAVNAENAVRLVSPLGVTTTLSSGFTGAIRGVAVDGPTVYVSTQAGLILTYGMATPAALTAAPTAPTLGGASVVFGACGAPDGYGDGTGDVSRQGATGLMMTYDATTAEVIGSDYASHTVRRLSPNGRINTFAGYPNSAGTVDDVALLAKFNGPGGMAVDPSGAAFVSELGGKLVRKVTAGAAVTRYAGTGAQGHVNGAGLTLAQFSTPRDVAYFGGSLFVADFDSYTVRKVAADQTVSTFAGRDGVQGFSDGGSGALLGAVNALAVDGAGNLFVADGSYHAIRKVAPDAAIVTVAGTGTAGFTNGNGLDAQFNAPFHLAVDTNGYLFVPDEQNNAVRLVSPAGLVSTYIATGIPLATSVALGAGGAFYMTGNADNCVKTFGVASPAAPTPSPGAPVALPTLSWTVSDNSATTVIEGTTADAQLNSASATGYDPVAAQLVVSDYGANVLARVSNAGRLNRFVGMVGTPGAVDGVTTTARLLLPFGLAVAGATGDAYFTEMVGSWRVRAVTPAGSVATLGGDGTAAYREKTIPADPVSQYLAPYDIAVSGTTTLLIVDNGRIRQMAIATTLTAVVAGAGQFGFSDGPSVSGARFNRSQGIAVASSGDIYVVDAGNHALRKITADFATTTTVAGTGGFGDVDGHSVHSAMYDPFRVASDGNGYLYITDPINGKIRLFDTSTNLLTAIKAGVPYPKSIAVNAAGSTVFLGATARYIEAYGVVGPTAVTASPAAPTTPPALSFTTGLCGTAGLAEGTMTQSRYSLPAGVAVNAAQGNVVLVMDAGAHRVRHIRLDGRVNTFVGYSVGFTDGLTTVAALNYPTSAAIDGAGNAFISDTLNHAVRHVTPAGAVSVYAGTGTTGYTEGAGIGVAQFATPYAVGYNGALVFVCDSLNNRIRKIAADQTVSTYAGSGLAGFTDGTAVSARLSSPMGIAFDSTGAAFTSSLGFHAIRKVATDGSVTTFAGTGAAGATDAAAGLASRFSSPRQLAMDANDYIYVADAGNALVRLVSPTGVVVTLLSAQTGVRGVAINAAATELHVAATDSYCVRSYGVGLPTATASPSAPTMPPLTRTAGLCGTLGGASGTAGINARFNTPYGIAVDTVAGALTVTEAGANRVRHVFPDGRVNVYAGGGAGGYADGMRLLALFNWPTGVDVDGSGNTFVADYTNNALRRIGSTGMVSRYAGTGVAGFVNGPGVATAQVDSPLGVALKGVVLFVCDSGNHAVRQVAADQTVATFAGSGTAGFIDGPPSNARFSSVRGIVFDSAGIAFVSEITNNAIRKIATDGSVSTFVGSGAAASVDGLGVSAAFLQPFMLAIDASDNIYVAEYGSGSVRLVEPSGLTSTLSTGHSLIRGIAVNGAGTEVHVPVAGDHCVKTYAASTPAPNTASPTAPTMPVLSFTTGQCGTAGFQDGTGAQARHASPSGVAIDPVNLGVVVTDAGTHDVRRVGYDQRVNKFAGSGTAGFADGIGLSATLQNPTAVIVDVSGNAFVMEGGNHAMRKITPGAAVSVHAGVGTAGLTNGPGVSTAEFNSAQGLCMHAGDIYVADNMNRVVRKVDASQVVSTYAGSGISGFVDGPAAHAGFRQVLGIAMDVAGVAFVTDTLNNAIRKIAADGSVSTFAGSGVAALTDAVNGVDAAFDTPYQLAIDAAGYLYVADLANNALRLVSPTGVTTTLATALAGLAGVAVNAAATQLHATAKGGHCVHHYGAPVVAAVTAAPDAPAFPATATTSGLCGTAGSVDGSEAATRYSAPQGLVLDPLSSSIFVADTSNNRVRRMTLAGQTIAVAGSGTADVTDQTGILAEFSAPSGVTCDAAGALFVVETGGHVVRQVTTAAVVTTIAGGASLSGFVDATAGTARFAAPTGACLAFGAAGLLVADTANNRIRHVVVATGAVTTFAGGSVSGFTDGAAPTLSAPSGIVMSASGFVYVSETGNSAIRKLAADGSSSTVAGTGAAGGVDAAAVHAQFSSPRGLAQRNGYLFVADEVTAAVRLISPAGLVTTLQSGFVGPRAVAFSANGKTAFVADSAAHCIRIYAIPRTDSRTITGVPTPTASRSQPATESVPLAPSASRTATLDLLPSASKTTSGTPAMVATTAVPMSTAAPTSMAASTTGAPPATLATSSPTTSAVPVAAPTLSMTVAAAAGYRATVTVSLGNETASAANLAAVAYTDTHASGVGYTTVSAHTSCANNSGNQSIACGVAALSVAAPTWSFDLAVDVKSYTRRNMQVRVHVTASDAAGAEASVVLWRSSPDATIAAAGARVPQTPAPGDAETVSSNTALRSVFSLDGGCQQSKMPIVLFAVAAFLVLLAVRTGVTLKADRSADAIQRLAPFDVAPVAGLLQHHVWVGAAAPCHHFCGPIHATLLLAQVLCIMAFASALIMAFVAADATATDNVLTGVFGFCAAFAAAALQAVLRLPFDMFAVDRTPGFRGERYMPVDIGTHEVGRVGVGLTDRTMRGFLGMAFEGEDGAAAPGGAMAKQRHLPTERVALGAPRVLGYAAAAGVSLIAIVTAFANTAPWCGTRWRTYETTLLVAVALDILLVQPANVLCVWLWRWMVSDEEDGRAVHNQHPVPGFLLPAIDDDAHEGVPTFEGAVVAPSVADGTAGDENAAAADDVDVEEL
jgi:sugar lactone lactonase YvrE